MLTSTDETGINTDDGTATAVASGGLGDLEYEWSNGAMTAEVDGLAPDTYMVTVTDEAGCTETGMVTIEEFTTGGTVQVSDEAAAKAERGAREEPGLYGQSHRALLHHACQGPWRRHD